MKKYARVYAEINGEALRKNIEKIRKKVPADTKVMSVIKADAYGHGAVFAAQMIDAFSDCFAVAIIEEALQLRESGVKKPIMILGYTSPENYTDAVLNDITLTVFTREAAEKLSLKATEAGKTAKVHIAVDTGMGRIGFQCNEAAVEEVVYISKLKNIFVEGMFTHFATADEADKEFTHLQMKRFCDFKEMLEGRGVNIPVYHASNSAAAMEVEEAAFNMVRPGIILYGLYPSDDVDKTVIELMPVMSLKTSVVFVKEINAGDTVSYGRMFTAKEKTRVATIPVGYADGYPRLLSCSGRVIINGKYAPIIGRVCMDQFMVDITGIPDVKEGDCVTLIGKDGECEITADEIAQLTQTINYEIVCDIGKRVPRKYVQE